MRLHRFLALAAILGSFALASPAHGQRGGRGGGGGGGMQRGGGGGGGMQRGGFGGGMSSPPAGMNRGVGGAMGGTGSRQGESRSYSGAMGGQAQTRSGTGSYTTSRGGTVDYGAAGARGTGAGGVSAGRGVYGVQGTTANGRSYSDYGRVGGVAGPNGNAVAGRSSVGSVSGANGTAYGASRGVVGVGPNGVAATSNRVGVAAGSNGAVAAGTSYGAAATRSGGTYYASSAAIAAQGDTARAAYAGSNYFSPNWYARYPSAWTTARYVAPVGIGAVGWPAVAGYCGYPQQPAYYDYGGNVVAQPGEVYVNGDQAGTPEQYAAQASQIAANGAATADDPNADWQPLGIYGIAASDDSPPNEFFQLAINRQGVLRGNYHNSATDTTTPIAGAVDPKTLRAAWTIGDAKAPVFDAGIANLTKDQTTLLVHDGANAPPQQATLVRMPPPDEAANSR